MFVCVAKIRTARANEIGGRHLRLRIIGSVKVRLNGFSRRIARGLELSRVTVNRINAEYGLRQEIRCCGYFILR